MNKPGRNDPCSCGSGEKFKKCCGKVLTLVASPPSPPTPSRGCGSCTACCDGWMVGTINGHDMKPGTPCHYVREGGCSIYEERPTSPCKNFSCAWVVAGSPFPEEFRPDKLGVIVVPIRWQNQPAYLLRSAGRDPDEALLSWMKNFSVQTGRPFFYEEDGAKIGFGSVAFQQDMFRRAEQGEPMW